MEAPQIASCACYYTITQAVLLARHRGNYLHMWTSKPLVFIVEAYTSIHLSRWEDKEEAKTRNQSNENLVSRVNGSCLKYNVTIKPIIH